MDVTLTNHEGESFESETVLTAGHEFIKCEFRDCTLILRNTPTLFNGCSFEKCNWHLDYDLLWGDSSTSTNLRTLLDLIDGTVLTTFTSETAH
jgi:hypothetical protein